MEFHGPLSVQEDWIRHLQQHILKMNYNKAAAPKAASTAPVDDPAPASTSTSSTTSTTPALTSTVTCATAPSSRSPTPPVAERAQPVTATEIVKVSEEQQPTLSPTSLPLPTQTV